MVEPSGGSAGGPGDGPWGARRGEASDAGELLDGVPDPWGVPSVVHLRARRTSVLVAAQGPGLPRVLHWGGDLGELSVDETDALAAALAAAGPDDAGAGAPLLPPSSDAGLTGLVLRAPAGVAAPRPVLARTRAALAVTAVGHQRLSVRAADAGLGVVVDLVVELDPAGVLRLRASAGVEPGGSVLVGGLHLVLPVPSVGRQVLVDVGGRLRPAATRRPPAAGPDRDVRPSEVLGAAVVSTAGSTSEELWALAATTVSRRSEARRAGDPLVAARRVTGGGLVLTGGEDVPGTRGETDWTTPLLVAAHGRTWADVRARLSAAGRPVVG
ncbi:hypothetical protein WDZ17_02875 [Pseudokineococcus basanitobsidens]|uniref:Uncharacterized protein n=1 Tax=Pseudokineococcus basanitobsidens TaxID=1926649 RepID=A0ABU8RGU5_9ACTN